MLELLKKNSSYVSTIKKKKHMTNTLYKTIGKAHILLKTD